MDFGHLWPPLPILSQLNDRCLDGGQVDDGNAVGVGAVDGAGVEDHRVVAVVDGGDVGVAVADEAVVAAVDGLAEAAVVVAVEERDADAVEREVAELAVACFVGGFDGGGERGLVVVAVAEDKMRGPGGEKLDDFGRADVAAMEDRYRRRGFRRVAGRVA